MDELVEKIARALIERQIRIARKWDTAPEELEANMPQAVDYAWRYRGDDARIALAAIRETHAIVPKEPTREKPSGVGVHDRGR